MSATRELPHSYIKIGKRYRKDLGDLSSLADSIRDIGLIQRIVVDKQHNLIVGHRRFEAWRLAKPDKAVPVIVVEDYQELATRLAAERDENTCRKDMTASELYELGKAVEKVERPKAATRQARPDAPRASSAPNGTNERSVRTSEKVGNALGVGRRKWQRIKALGDAAEAGNGHAKELLAAVDAGEMTVSGAEEMFRANGKAKDQGAFGNRSVPKAKSATHMLTKLCEQLDGIAAAINTIDVAETTTAEAPAIAENLSRFRTVLSKTINSLRSIT